jgi:hypothetical protein
MWGNNMAPSTTDAEKVMQLMAWDIAERNQFALGSGKQFTNRVVLMTEPVANILKDGYQTIGHLEEALIENSRRPAYERALANYYANPGSRKDGGEHSFNQYLSHIIQSEGGEETPTPAWYDTQAITMTTIPTMQKGATAFLVTGDASRNKVQTMPGGGFSTARIDLPAAWDSIMAAKGYPALKDLHLSSTSSADHQTAVKPFRTNVTTGKPVRTDYYNMRGQRTNRNQRGSYIQRNVYSSGASQTQKVLIQ